MIELCGRGRDVLRVRRRGRMVGGMHSASRAGRRSGGVVRIGGSAARRTGRGRVAVVAAAAAVHAHLHEATLMLYLLRLLNQMHIYFFKKNLKLIC